MGTPRIRRTRSRPHGWVRLPALLLRLAGLAASGAVAGAAGAMGPWRASSTACRWGPGAIPGARPDLRSWARVARARALHLQGQSLWRNSAASWRHFRRTARSPGTSRTSRRELLRHKGFRAGRRISRAVSHDGCRRVTTLGALVPGLAVARLCASYSGSSSPLRRRTSISHSASLCIMLRGVDMRNL